MHRICGVGVAEETAGVASQPCAKRSPVRATWRKQRLGTHARELCGWRSVREGCAVQALRVGKKPARVKRWQTWTAHSESLTQKRTHNVACGCTHSDTAQQARARAFSHSLAHSLTSRTEWRGAERSALCDTTRVRAAVRSKRFRTQEPGGFLSLFLPRRPSLLRLHDAWSPVYFLRSATRFLAERQLLESDGVLATSLL